MSRGRNDNSQSVLSDLMECHLYTTSIKREDHLHFKKRHGKKKKFNSKHFSCNTTGKKCRKRAEYISKLESESATPSRSAARGLLGHLTRHSQGNSTRDPATRLSPFFGSPRPLPWCLRAATLPEGRTHPRFHRYHPLRLRPDLLARSPGPRAVWHGTPKVSRLPP